MAKIPIDKAVEIMKKNEVPPTVLRQIVEEMNLVTAEKDGGEKPPPLKKQWVIMVSDPQGLLPETDFAGWVLQIPESESAATTQDRINKATYEYNATRKGQLHPANTVGEALESIPAKHFKEAEVWVKTKVPVLMMRTNNEIPKDETNHIDRRTSGNQAVSGYQSTAAQDESAA